jgi:uncharacterized protein (TIGR03435 family)
MKTIRIALGLGSVSLFVALAQPPGATPHFEAADVHRSASAPNPYTWASGGVLRGPRYDLRKATMIDLIHAAFGFDPDLIVGGPDWLEFDRFDVAAKADPATPPATVRLMLQNLLSDRFHLVIHKDTRPMPAYTLSAGNGKPKLRESDGTGLSECRWQQQPDGFSEEQCHNMTMDAFAVQLHGFGGDYLTSPVVNATGIEGAWDFGLRWNPRSRLLAPGAERTTIFDAVDKQLGLVLTPSMAPTQVLVIDRVNENPSPNAADVAQKIQPRAVEFEVADLKISKNSTDRDFYHSAPDGGLEIHNAPLASVMASAWDAESAFADEAFANIPKWVYGTRVDINAKAPRYPGAPLPAAGSGLDDDIRLMLKNLLVERFQMKTHVENRMQDAYTLVARKPKMARAEPGRRPGCRNARNLEHDPRDTNPLITRVISCQNVTMAQFASLLHPFALDYIIDKEVEDATGLTGRYDFTLAFSSRPLVGVPVQNESSDPSGAISLGEAISRQLGLKLEMRKRSLPIVVIDHMEETPLEN